jgi:GWxTD domain-containing protein
VARLESDSGRVVTSCESTAVAGRSLEGLVNFDGSTLPSGVYALEVKAWQEGDAGALVRRSRLSVGWEPGTWYRDPDEIVDEAHFLLQKDEEELFVQMLPGEQERHLIEFWRRRDPTPGTPENELKAKFLERVDYTNQMFSRTGLGRGMFSDMGRTYIRYGEPSEVYHSVIPGPDNELSAVISRYVTENDRPLGNVDDPSPGADMRPFEVWIYEGEIALPFDADLEARPYRRLSKPLVFLFIDERWLGDYRLRYSTE